MTPESSTPQPSTPKATPEPDLVDRIFAYLEAELPQALRDVDHLKANIRAEFGGLDWYIPVKPRGASRQRQQEVLRLFNGPMPKRWLASSTSTALRSTAW